MLPQFSGWAGNPCADAGLVDEPLRHCDTQGRQSTMRLREPRARSSGKMGCSENGVAEACTGLASGQQSCGPDANACGPDANAGDQMPTLVACLRHIQQGTPGTIVSNANGVAEGCGEFAYIARRRAVDANHSGMLTVHSESNSLIESMLRQYIPGFFGAAPRTSRDSSGARLWTRATCLPRGPMRFVTGCFENLCVLS